MNKRQWKKFHKFQWDLLLLPWDEDTYYMLLNAYFLPDVFGRKYSEWVRRTVRGIAIYLYYPSDYPIILPRGTTNGLDYHNPNRKLNFIFDEGPDGCKVFDIDAGKLKLRDSLIVHDAIQSAKEGDYVNATSLLMGLSSNVQNVGVLHPIALKDMRCNHE